MTPKPDKSRMRGVRYIALVSQLPFMIIAGYGLGYALDSWWGTSFMKVVCLIAGAIGGMGTIVRELIKDAGSK